MSWIVLVCWQENWCVSDRDLTSLVRVTWHLSVVSGKMSHTFLTILKTPNKYLLFLYILTKIQSW